MLEKGLVQIYTGNGKGKTTAAFGLALRAAGHGAKILIYQFLKPATINSGECKAVAAIENITVEMLNMSWEPTSFDDEKAVADARRAINAALDKIEKAAAEKQYDMIILDEIVFCLYKGLARLEDIKRIIGHRDASVEIVLTGRGASDELIKAADLVTEMKVVKHPYSKGIKARKAIEF